MYFLYSLTLSALFLVLLPYFIYQAIRHGKYLSSFRERMGWLKGSLRSDGRQTIWIHTVSVGEFLAARPLLELLRREFPDRRLVVSTTTITGQRLARSHSPTLFDAVFYFPFDWPFSVRRALKHIEPQVVIILETELWPNFLRQCRKLNVKTVIANGRISPRSFSRYMKVRRFVARVLDDVSLLVMQSEADAQRARLLGARPQRVRVCGSLKYDAPEIEEKRCIEELDNQFALSACEHLIVAGSTAPGEEEILLAALKEARKREGLQDARLVIAPRHPERFNEVASLIAKSGFTFARRSDAAANPVAQARSAAIESSFNSQPDQTDRLPTADVLLLDTIGELAMIYRFATVVFVGGSLVARGGHNIIEPARFAKPIIVGPHTENFRQIIADFCQARALAQLKESGDGEPSDFTRELIRLLSDREAARAMGERARDLLLKNRGAAHCTMTAIKKVLSSELK